MLALNCSPEKEAGWGGLAGGGAFPFPLLLALPLVFAEPAVAADAVARAAERERYDSLEPPTKEIAKKGTSALTKSMAGGVALLAVLLALYFLYA